MNDYEIALKRTDFKFVYVVKKKYKFVYVDIALKRADFKIADVGGWGPLSAQWRSRHHLRAYRQISCGHMDALLLGLSLSLSLSPSLSLSLD